MKLMHSGDEMINFVKLIGSIRSEIRFNFDSFQKIEKFDFIH
jgi:hypothetical protein